MDCRSLAAVVSSSTRAAFFSLLGVAITILAVLPAQASDEDDWFLDTVVDHRPQIEKARTPVPRPDGALTVDLSMSEFLDLQRLDEGDRRTRLGLPADCIPGLTAMMPTTATSDHLVVMITCTKTP